MSGPVHTATQLGLRGCHRCGQVNRLSAVDEVVDCPRCGATLRWRKPGSVQRAWALLIAAMLLYIPANTMTMMRTANPLEVRDDTIVSGVLHLAAGGSWELAAIVFIASVMVPLSKFGTLILLLLTAQRGSDWRRAERARLYRIIEGIGHWSMLDVFVVALLVALVHFPAFGTVEAGPAAMAFGGVVLLTMLASKSFDPRLIWDEPRKP
ncbi:MAG TPA: paraquat-inducible protein A [Solimonas sp.]|nr:paraquat-inducible protein A [Solimonas sp.]